MKYKIGEQVLFKGIYNPEWEIGTIRYRRGGPGDPKFGGLYAYDIETPNGMLNYMSELQIKPLLIRNDGVKLPSFVVPTDSKTLKLKLDKSGYGKTLGMLTDEVYEYLWNQEQYNRVEFKFNDSYIVVAKLKGEKNGETESQTG